MADALADQRLVALVVGMDGDRGVAQHRLGAGGGDDDLARAVGERVGEFVQLGPHVLFMIDFEVAERRAAAHTPVDQPFGPIEEPFLVQPRESLPHRARGPLVHGEALAIPVERGAQRAVLHRDAAARLLLPGPDAAKKFFPAEVLSGFVFCLPQIFLDRGLRSNARVIGSRQPKHFESLHARAPGEDVLDRVVKNVPER